MMAKPAVRLALGLALLIAAARSVGTRLPAAGQIAMDVYLGATSDVGLLDLRSGSLLWLARAADIHEYSPNWSPDGRRLLFQSATVGQFAHALPIQIMDILTRRLRPVSEYFGVAPVWSPDGTQIAFDIVRRYVVVDVRDGSESIIQAGVAPGWAAPHVLREQLVDALASTAEMAARFARLDEPGRRWLVYATLRQAVLAPDGRHVAVVLYDGRNLRRLAVMDMACLPECVGALEERVQMPMIASPTWSSDGSQLAFACTPRDDAAAMTGICVMPSSGGEARFLLRTTRLRHTDGPVVAWRPGV